MVGEECEVGLGATGTTNTSGIGVVSVAVSPKVPGSNPTSDTWVFSSIFNPSSLDLLPRTTVKLN